MTKFKITIIFISSIFLFGSCEDILREEPKSSISVENFFRSEDDALAAANGMYDVLRYMYRSYVFRMDEVPSDDVLPGPQAAADEHSMEDYIFDPENRAFIITWQYHFWGITRANSIIQNVPGINMEEEIKNRILGEANFFRAFCYFKLVRYFGEVPVITRVFDDLESLDVPRDPIADVYRQIIEDLQYAETNLPATYPASGFGRATSGAAKTLLVKVYLTRAALDPSVSGSTPEIDYQLAANKAKEVIDAGNYMLEPKYADIFDINKKYTQREVIFAWDALGGLGIGSGEGGEYTRSLLPRTFSDIILNGPGRFYYQPEPETYYMYEIGDDRRDVNLLFGETGHRINFINLNGDTLWLDKNGDSINVKVEAPHIWKYKDFDAEYSGDDGNLFPILRYADVLLMYAEALNEINNGPTQEALDAINQVRERARNKQVDEEGIPLFWGHLPDYTMEDFGNKGEFLNAIIDERRWELAFEGHRRLDLLRWGKLIETLKEKGNQNIQEHHTLFPVPQQERDANPMLSQNPGYPE